MQYSLPPKRTFEELLARHIQKWNSESVFLKSTCNRFRVDARFLQPLLRAFLEAGHNASIDEDNLITVSDLPVYHSGPLLDDFWLANAPNDRILRPEEIVHASPLANVKQLALSQGTVWAFNPATIEWLLENGFEHVGHGLYGSHMNSKAYKILNDDIVRAKGSSWWCSYFHSDLALGAGYVSETTIQIGMMVRMAKVEAPVVMEEWTLEQFQTTVIPANVQVTNGALLRCLSHLCYLIDELDVGLHLVVLSDSVVQEVSFDAFKGIVEANGYLLFTSNGGWVVDLLGVASAGEETAFEYILT